MSWGAKVSPAFRTRVRQIATDIRYPENPGHIMAVMAQEAGTTFSPSSRNAAGSGAVGLIQFMPQTAAMLGTSSSALARMSAEGQLDYVERYFMPAKGRLKNLGDLYCWVLWPGGVGKTDDAVLFSRALRPTTYLQNKGLDFDHDGDITRAEVVARVKTLYATGLKTGNVA
jgi:hypothetical protein